MILSVSLARNAIFLDVSGCPCARGIAAELLRRLGNANLRAFGFALGSAVAVRVDNPEPKQEDKEARALWSIFRCAATGIAVVWALENAVVVACDRREEPLGDGDGVFTPKGWESIN